MVNYNMQIWQDGILLHLAFTKKVFQSILKLQNYLIEANLNLEIHKYLL